LQNHGWNFAVFKQHSIVRTMVTKNFNSIGVYSAALMLAGVVSTGATSYSIFIEPPASPRTEDFHMGTATRPDGTTLTLNNDSFLLDGKPWMPVMGEFHYSRYPENEWREELLKMKAGGVDIVATYVFWIHHEEREGQWDWSGRRDLRKFVQLCNEVGLKVIVRCGPFDHGEVRNGGFPDWLLEKGWALRSDDPPYLDEVQILYDQIAKQLSGLLWKDGGPVIGIQFENEYNGPASHLLTLKRLGREAGLDAPIYTRTGWDTPKGAMPFGEVVPLYGAYAEGFWDRVITPMPAGYWKAFIFSTNRMDDAELPGVPGKGGKADPPDAALYPYLTCEIGGGMEVAYHRRILNYPEDSEAMTLIKIGSGSVMPGYYMYHGGENPDGKLTTLQESQATGFWNDMPVKNYDFQAPLGVYGQIRPQYHLLRRLHLFLHEWGQNLADMGVSLPEPRPEVKGDTNTLRWCVRSDGHSGFVFVNNYERLRYLPPKADVQFALKLLSSDMTFPEKAVTIPAGACFFWPFNFDLGYGVTLFSATAQPMCAINDGDTRTIFFAQTRGVPAEFIFDKNVRLKVSSGKISSDGDKLIADEVKPGRRAALQIETKNGLLQIVLLSEADSLALWKGAWQGRDRVFFTRAGLVLDWENMRLTSTESGDLSIGIFPAPSVVTFNGQPLIPRDNGIFKVFTPAKPKALSFKPMIEQIQPAGPARDIPLGKIQDAVAAAPEDADFATAAVWKIKLPENIDMSVDPILQLNYAGDVARVSLNGKLLMDDFYNGNKFEVGLRRYAPDIFAGDLRVAILPLRKNAPIYLADSAKPDFGSAKSIVELRGVKIIPRYQVQLSAH
ncbi:MAG TPA: beta-galactosidase, partial [Candidatus Acidoferrales bacterium]|nr:beta-galactosidase [Candidatus Acidoferrales bacterium]